MKTENSTATEKVTVVVSGASGLTLSVGQLLTRALEAEGACVGVTLSVPDSTTPMSGLQGTLVRLDVQGSARAEQRTEGSSFVHAAKLAVGLLLLAVLLGAEVRLRLGLGEVVLSAAVGGWLLWRQHAGQGRSG